MTATQPNLLFQDNPESILRKPRQPNNTRERQQSLTSANLRELQKSLRATLPDQRQGVGSDIAEEPSQEAASVGSEDDNPLQLFYRNWGYLSPFTEESAALIEAIIDHPEMAHDNRRVSPTNEMFSYGLSQRKVSLKESLNPDPYVNTVNQLEAKETGMDLEKELAPHRQLWLWDQKKCDNKSNEGLYQRTIMMSLIVRQIFIYRADEKGLRYLDFSAEVPWTCPPMPSRAYDNNQKFLTQPKPDLAVSFLRESVVGDDLWDVMPPPTQRLACFEKIDDGGRDRIFHFFTIEAKKSQISSGDAVGRLQSLNNASQALHNMYEFFKDAGTIHEQIFFDRVRFFSVVASTEGLTVRIHRAIRKTRSGDLIMPDRPEYPLNFEWTVFARSGASQGLDQESVFKLIQRILIAYGIQTLKPLIHSAAKALSDKLIEDSNLVTARFNEDFYRYGQVKPSPTTAQTANLRTANSATVSVQGRGTRKGQGKKRKAGGY